MRGRIPEPERVTLLIGVLVLVVSFGAGGYTYATFVDAETTSASIQAADDFTTAIADVRIEPSQIEADSGGGLASSDVGRSNGDGDGGTAAGDGVFTVYADVPDPESVDSDRFTLGVAGGDESIRALRARCKSRTTGDWTCKATFARRDLLALDVEPGTVTLVLQGWREYDRDFEGTGTVEIVDAGPTSTAAEATELEASVESDTPTETETETETSTESSTATDASTATGTDETDTPPESSTATEIATDGTDMPTEATESATATTTTNTTSEEE